MRHIGAEVDEWNDLLDHGSTYALIFLGAVATKLVRLEAGLASSGQAWVNHFPSAAVKLIWLPKVLGAFGVILPSLTGVAEVLSPIAAFGLALMVLGVTAVTNLRSR